MKKRSIKQCCLSWVSSSKQKCRTAVLLPCTIFSVSVELSRNIHRKTHYINILRTKSHLNHLVWFHFKGKLASCFLGSLRELLKLLSSYSSNWHFVNFLFFCFFFPFTFIRTLFVHWSFSMSRRKATCWVSTLICEDGLFLMLVVTDLITCLPVPFPNWVGNMELMLWYLCILPQ